MFIDSDPAFTQLAIAKNEEWYVNFFRGFNRLFTFGSNIGTDGCAVPDRRVHVAEDVAAGGHLPVADGRRTAAEPLHVRHELDD